MKAFPVIATIGIAFALGFCSLAVASDSPTAISPTEASAAQPGSDTWITTRIKVELLATKGIPSTQISVTTTDGAVMLVGVLESKAQVQGSIAVAQAVKGVTNVDSAALTLRH